MLVEVKQLKTVNATAYIYDDFCKPATKENKEAIENRCSEIMLPELIKEAAKKNTA